MPISDIECVNCRKLCSYRFCSNECFREYAPSRAGVDCAVCRYHADNAPTGSVDTNRICPECRAEDAANSEWGAQPGLEATGFEMDDFEAGSSAQLQPRRDPYATKLAIEIMAMHCAGKSNRAIARALECARRYVDRTVLYWKSERGEKLAIIKTLTKMKIRKAH